MDKLLFKIFLCVVIIPVLFADSIGLNKAQVLSHYYKNNDYAFQAAHFGSAQANYQLFNTYQLSAYLDAAASHNHIEAVYQKFERTANNENKSTLSATSLLWLNKAAMLGHEKAIVKLLGYQVQNKQWHAASQHINTYASQIQQKLSESLLTKWQQYENMTLSATQPLVPHTIETSESVLTSKKQSLACPISILPLISNNAFRDLIEEYQQAFSQSLLAKNNKDSSQVCFQPIVFEPMLNAMCRQTEQQVIDCNLAQLATRVVKNKSFSHLLVMVERGGANTRGGLMMLDANDSPSVFLHELAHWFALVDEYPIATAQQNHYCEGSYPRWVGNNVFVAPINMTKSEAEKLAGQPLFDTNTCSGSEKGKAYKNIKQTSFMEYLDIPLDQDYANLILTSFDPARTVPVAQNFAQHFSEINVKAHRYWLKRSAELGYREAKTQLATLLIEEGKYTDAYLTLLEAAQAGSTTAQIFLGHGFLEGRWTKQDLVSSAFWYQQAADGNDSFGIYYLAKCYEKGWGCALSKEKAIELYQQAKKLGNPLAIKRLKQFELH